MILIINLLNLLLFLYTIVLLARVVLDWIQLFSRGWRPTGVILVIANVVYGLTDPPLRLLGRFIPPLRLGGIALDLSSMILIFGLVILESVCISLLLSA